jgi:phage regulator Rha-like protein
MAKAKAPVPVEGITRSILVLRGHRVLLDEDLAALYGVEVRVLVQAVKRNIARFPEDFIFQLTASEWAALRSQFVTLKAGRGQHRKYQPYAFTEHGVAMLSSVLRSERAIAVNVQIMRAFVRMRELLTSNTALARKLDELERKYKHHDEAIAAILSAIRELMNPPQPKRRPIGFTADL